MKKICGTSLFFIIMVLAVSCGQKKIEKKLTTAPSYSSLADAKAAATPTKKLIAIDFYTDWCSWCKKLDTEVYTDPKVISLFSHEMVLAKINAEKDTVLANEFHISGFPTIVLTDSDGKEIDRIIGYLPAADFLQTLQNYQKGIGTLADLLQQADTVNDRSLYFEIADKYKYRGGDKEAIKWYQKVIDEGKPTDSLSGESRMALADMFRRAKDYDKALKSFSSIMKDFKRQSFAMDAEIWKAIVYRQKSDTAKAITAFENFIKHYPNSKDVGYATKQINKLKGKAGNKK
ncbi:MAG: thioredoxin fold domain-containing protein [FCB group bacterium]|nr:thioredoxin fold domain-containing protein [FCB group bacterium]